MLDPKESLERNPLPVASRCVLPALAIALALIGGCKQKFPRDEVAGVYVYMPGAEGARSDEIQYRLNRDGTFIRYERSQETDHGTWSIDRTSSTGEVAVDLPEREYRLINREGMICWEIEPGRDYRCKVKDP